MPGAAGGGTSRAAGLRAAPADNVRSDHALADAHFLLVYVLPGLNSDILTNRMLKFKIDRDMMKTINRNMLSEQYGNGNRSV